MFKFLVGLIAKGLKLIWHAVLAVIGLGIAGYGLYQVHFAYSKYQYEREGGVFVVDDITDPPLSQEYRDFHYGTIAEAINKTKELKYIDRIETVPVLDQGERMAIWRAFRKFPTIESCLTHEGREQNDVNQFNWGALRTYEQAKLCLFHMGNELNLDLDKIAEWMEGQGFKTSVYKRNPEDSRVSGHWRHENINSPFPVFSTMKLIEYGPDAWITGRWRKRPGIQIFVNSERNQIREVNINYIGK